MSTPTDPPEQPRYGGSSPDPYRDPAEGQGSGSRPPGYGDDRPPAYGDDRPPAYGGGQPPAYGGGEQPPSYGSYGSSGGNEGYGGYGGYGDDRPPENPRNGMGLAALIVGIVAILAVCFGFVLFGVPAIIIGIIGIVLGVIGRRRVKRGQATNGGAAMTGLVLSAIATVLGIASLVLILVGLSFVGDCADEPTQQAQQQCIEDELGFSTS